MFLFQFKSKEIHGELNLSKEKLEKELNDMLRSYFGLKDSVITVSVLIVKDGMIEGKNSISLRLVNVPKNMLEDVARESLKRINKMLESTPYRCESNLLIHKPLVPGKNSNSDPVKAYFSLNVVRVEK